MLDTRILELTYELKEKLINSDEYKLVKEKEKIMEEKCSNLLIRYNYLMDEYNNAIRFEKYGSDVDRARKSLANAKLELDIDETKGNVGSGGIHLAINNYIFKCSNIKIS